MDSILATVKKLLGITEEYTHFDNDLILHINSVFSILHQLGIGPDDGYAIHDASETWSDYLSDGAVQAMVRTYVGLKVRMLFDPPTSSPIKDAITRSIDELEWRLSVADKP